MNLLENIKSHQDLAALDENQRVQLCLEIRDFLINKVSKTGGHLASNLGVVELTVAIETVFDTEKDRLVFDVGHQSYIHKLLTGRQADFDALRQFGGMAGFPKPNESVHDAFIAGHASSSVSIALGMARARSLSKQNYQVIALIGDGAATGGMAYEGLADAAVSNEPMIVILNDNAMSIDHNVGGMALHLTKLRSKERYLGMKQKYRNFTSKIPGGNFVYRVTRAIKDRLRRMLIPTTIFENMGFTYFGPVDGHDTEELIALLRLAKNMNRPVLIHVMTKKGRGYQPAEENPSKFHGIGKFDPATGETLSTKMQTFSDAFGETMLELGNQDEKVCAITAAMPGGTGLLEFKKQFPKRLFDVGIAEEHAVSMAGGLAKQGMKPVVAIYSTFLQRAYDMILQDVGMQNLNVVFAVDRAGLVGEDGETHHGIYDIGFLRQIPDMKILCPASCEELQSMLKWAVKEHKGPVALRYPRGGNRGYNESAWGTEEVVCHSKGSHATLITYGTMLDNVTEAAALLQEQGVFVTVLRLLTVAPIPVEELTAKVNSDAPVFVIEETAAGCGLKEEISWILKNKSVYGVDLGHQYITHGAMNDLYQHYGLDAESIARFVQEVVYILKIKKRLDVLLVEQGHADSRTKAQAIIMSGQVYVDGQKADKPGVSYEETVAIEVRSGSCPYVSRGGLKLEKALRDFGVKPEGYVCSDSGASTGGFTDCLLQQGASKVFAIDVGYGQLDWKIRSDPRVVVMERTNVRYVTPEQLGEPLDLSVVDVSFISLKIVLPVIKTFLKPEGQVLCLIKPQFEAGKDKVGKKGVVREPKIHKEVLDNFVANVTEIGFRILGMTFSPVKGPEGNIEFLAHLTLADKAGIMPDTDNIVSQAHETLRG